MARFQPISQENASPQAAEILSNVEKKMGMVPEMIATMANSPAVANAYLSFSGALASGGLPATLREQIALTVGQANECNYCLSAHSKLGQHAGLSDSEIERARQGTSEDATHAAALELARKLVDQRGNVSDGDLSAVREAGYTDGEIGEIVANVALNLFTNYFNHVADPEIDFPLAQPLTCNAG